jgi:hypothetical protein
MLSSWKIRSVFIDCRRSGHGDRTSIHEAAWGVSGPEAKTFEDLSERQRANLAGRLDP